MIKEELEKRRAILQKRYPVWERKTLGERLDDFVREFGEREFLFTLDKTYTYRELGEKVDLLARALIKLGIKNREHIAVLLPNYPEFFFLQFAIAKIGAVNVPLNYRLKALELSYAIKQSDSVCLITIDQFGENNFIEMLLEICPGLFKGGGDNKFPLLRKIIAFSPQGSKYEGLTDFYDFVAEGEKVSIEELRQVQSRVRYPDEICNIVYTACPSGPPVGVMVTHDMLLRSTYAACLSRAFEDGRRVFLPIPLYHIFAYVEGFLAVMFVGGCIIPQVNFTPRKALELIEKGRANDILCLPLMMAAMVNVPHLEKYDLNNLRATLNSAAYSPVGLWEKIRDKLGIVELCGGYGMMEMSASMVHTEPGTPPELLAISVGRIKPGGCSGLPEFNYHNLQYKILDPVTGKDLPPYAEGELACRGNTIMCGYYKKPLETAKVLDKDGWLRTGDIGRFRPDGNFELTGRIKDIFRVNGENVASKEVEDVIGCYSKVKQVYVVGVPDAKADEIGMAYIELKEGEEATPEEIINYCREKLARFKVPKYIKFLKGSDFPFTPSGKIQKYKLVEMAIDELGLQGVSNSFLYTPLV